MLKQTFKITYFPTYSCRSRAGLRRTLPLRHRVAATEVEAATISISTGLHDFTVHQLVIHFRLLFLAYCLLLLTAPQKGQASITSLIQFPVRRESLKPLLRFTAHYDATCTWSGVLPPRSHRLVTYSSKIFLGGMPWDISEQSLVQIFKPFGSIK